MSYDLYFKSRNQESKPDANAFATYFKQRKNYETTDKQAIYQNEATGVYFVFDLNEVESEEQPGLLPLSFNLNYFRPHIFGLEAAKELQVLVDRFDLLVSDTQINGMGEDDYSEQKFLSGWNMGNEFGYRSVLEQSPTETPPTLPTKTIENCWRWNFAKEELQQKLGDDVFVPRFLFILLAGQVFPTIAWSDGIPIAMPESKKIFIPRKAIQPKKFFSRVTEDVVLADWNEIFPILQQFPIEQGVLPYRLLAYSKPPSSVIAHLRSLKPNGEKASAVSVDKILNSELIEKARAK